jgi:hypothetical protein
MFKMFGWIPPVMGSLVDTPPPVEKCAVWDEVMQVFIFVC